MNPEADNELDSRPVEEVNDTVPQRTTELSMVENLRVAELLTEIEYGTRKTQRQNLDHDIVTHHVTPGKYL